LSPIWTLPRIEGNTRPPHMLTFPIIHRFPPFHYKYPKSKNLHSNISSFPHATGLQNPNPNLIQFRFCSSIGSDRIDCFFVFRKSRIQFYDWFWPHTMSAIVCGKRSFFEELPTSPTSVSPPVSKKLRCSSSTSPVRRSPFTNSPAASALIDQLRDVFPNTDKQVSFCSHLCAHIYIYIRVKSVQLLLNRFLLDINKLYSVIDGLLIKSHFRLCKLF